MYYFGELNIDGISSVFFRIRTNLTRIVDPQFVKDHSEDYNDLSIDLITWKSIILSALGKLYGLIGEASHFDILQTLETKLAKKVIIRIQPEDKEKIINCLMAFTFKLSKFIGGEYDTNCHVRVNKNSDYLGLVLDKSNGTLLI